MMSMHHPSAELPRQLLAHTRTRDRDVVCDDRCIDAILTPCALASRTQCAADAVASKRVHLERVANVGALGHPNRRLRT
jgi:hypothetical protein